MQTDWYAFRTFHNYSPQFVKKLQAESLTYFVTELFPSIVFVRATAAYVQSIACDPQSRACPYTYPGDRRPAVISDEEMDTFMFVLGTGCREIDIVDEKLARGDRVRVLEGVFKGAEGYIVRIKGDRRFVVSIHGVVAVATSYIPGRFLEKID